MNDIPIAKLGWALGDSREKHAIYFEYSLAMGPSKQYNGNIDLPSNNEQLLQHFLKWVLENITPNPYMILGAVIKPRYEVYEVRHAIIGSTFNIPEGKYVISFHTIHPTEEELGPSKSFSITDFPAEIREFLISINKLLWDTVRNDLVEKFKLSKDAIPIYLEKHVFLAFRATNEKGKQVAKELGKFLQDKKLQVWYFPWKVGWADSFTDKEDQAIINSFGAVLCITPDFFDGPTAKEEYRALSAKRRTNSDFRLGYLLVGCEHSIVPPFMSDYFGAKVESADDKNFVKEVGKIYRGLLGLPLEAP